MTRRSPDEPEIHRITDARRSHTEDMNRRINRYLLSMAIRTVCVVMIFFVEGPLRWVFAAGAIFLPYIAVLFANASDQRSSAPIPKVDHRALPSTGSSGSSSSPSSPLGEASQPTEPVLEGQVISRPAPSAAPSAGTPTEPPA